MEIDTHEAFYSIYNDKIFPKLVFNQDGSTLDITTLAMQALLDIAFAAGINYYKPYGLPYDRASELIRERFTTTDYCLLGISEVDLMDMLEQAFIEGLNTGLQSDYFSD